MIKYSHRWLLFNSTTTDNQVIYPYCLRSEETLDHDHFLTCNESEEQKDVRIKSFSQLLTQLQTPSSLTTLLINGLKLAYQEYHQPIDQSSPTQHNAIVWSHFIREMISTELTKTMTTHYKSSAQTNQRFTGKGWTKAIVKFMLETHVNEWKHRCELKFHPKSILHNNEFMSFHKRSLLITVDHFISKMESLSLSKQKWILDSKDEYQKMSVKQIFQWITNTKILFKTNRSYKNNNRKITEYFGKD